MVWLWLIPIYLILIGMFAQVYGKCFPRWKCKCCLGPVICGHWVAAVFWPVTFCILIPSSILKRVLNRPKPQKKIAYCLCPECEKKFLEE